MNITKLLGKKNTAKKLNTIIEIVADARKKYNNTKAEITSPVVSTCNGGQNLKYLSEEDKAAVATRELNTILTQLNALDAEVEGVNVNKELTSMIATNAVLTNLEASLSLGLE